MNIHYLEIVTLEADATIDLYSKLYKVTFAKSNPNLGGARTAKIQGGGIIGIRPPLRMRVHLRSCSLSISDLRLLRS
ncbi:hypothetical protein ACFSW8_14225, partial [Rubritalea tangerina]